MAAAGDRPLAMRSQDDRGPAYTAAVERSEAAFAAVRQALSGGVRAVNTAADLAAFATALPPETSIIVDPVTRAPAGAEHGRGWTSSVVASLATLAEQPATPVRDHRGREHDVLVPAVELGRWLLPPGPDTPGEAEGRACGRYDRLIEALDREGPGDSLRAAGAVLGHIADLLTGEEGAAQYLPDGSPVSGQITAAARELAGLAARLAALAGPAEAEEAG